MTPLEEATKFVKAELAKRQGKPLTAADEWQLILDIMRQFGLSEETASAVIRSMTHGEPL